MGTHRAGGIIPPDRLGVKGSLTCCLTDTITAALSSIPDSYGSIRTLPKRFKHVPRDKVTVLTKTWAREPPPPVRPGRFRRELGIDQHRRLPHACLTEGDWTER